MKVVTANEKCYVCGKYTDFIIHDKATLLREARCGHCNASLRNSDMAKEIVRTLTGKDKALKEVLYDLSAFRILNTCSSGPIHSALHRLPGYVASEYYDDVPNGEKRGNVVSADLMNLPFDSECFDLIISEDVFEHIADYKRAFNEIHRTLTGGYHIFTVPYHEGRRTISRMGNEKKIYHGDPIREAGSLVITDFGDDLPEILENLGFKTEVICTHKFYEPYEITNADDSYAEFRSKIDRMDEYFKYNSVVFISAIKDLQMNKSQKEAERMHSLLQAQYLDAVSITGFDANEDLEVPDGCYGIEGDKGNRFTWASKEVSINLRHKADKAILAIDGYVSMDMYYRKGLGKLKLSVYAGDDIMLLIEKEYVESTGVEIRISLAEYLSAAGTQGYIPITICASDSVCPKEEGTGEDARNLSWILNRVYWQYADR